MSRYVANVAYDPEYQNVLYKTILKYEVQFVTW